MFRVRVDGNGHAKEGREIEGALGVLAAGLLQSHPGEGASGTC